MNRDAPEPQLGLFAASETTPPLVVGRASAAPFAEWGRVAAAVRATRARTAKVAIVAEYLRGLDAIGAEQGVRWLAGTPLPQGDPRALRVGRAVSWPILAELGGVSLDEVGQRRVVLGSTAAVAAALLAGREGGALSLGDMAWAIDQLAETRVAARRTALVRELLAAAGGEGAPWVIAILGGGLRIGLLGAQVEEAIAAATGAPLEQVRDAQALAGDVGAVMARARAGTLEATPFALGRPLGFMLAQPVATPEALVAALPSPCVVEAKYDGIRAQLHVTASGVRLFSRTRDDITAAFPELASVGRTVPVGTVLDGELVALDADAPTRVAPFRVLQGRLGRRAPSLAVRRAVPVAFVAFDLLAVGSARVVTAPWRERRAQLVALLPDDAAALVRLAPVTWVADAAAVAEAFDAARAAGHEGLVAKHPDSAYEAGRRGKQWIKLKTTAATLDVVVTAAERGNGRRAGVLSDLTFAVRHTEEDPTLLDIGKAYSGLTDAELAALTQTLEGQVLEQRGGWPRVAPTIVLEVTFDLVQPSPRHASGYALRFPRIVRLRPDKPVAEIDTLARVRALAGDTPP